jgi:hypothetical protein
MKLPVRIEVDGEQIEDVELREMSGADIAEVKKIGSNGDMYSAFLAFAVCATRSLGDIGEKSIIREAYKNATFDTVYAVAVSGMALTRGIDRIEGRYKCKCGNIVDHTGEFADPLPSYDPVDNTDVSFSCSRIEIYNSKTQEVVFSAEKLLMRRPTVKDLIKAFHKFPDDETQMQFEVYRECIKQVDDKDISDKDRVAYGDMIFRKMSFSDLKSLSEALSLPYGKTECVCMKCKRRWSAELDLTNFFDYEAD